MKLKPMFVLTWKGVAWGIPAKGRQELAITIYSFRWWPW